MSDHRNSDESTEETIGYAEAVAELDALLGELEDDTIDIDLLGARVRRAAELIRICRGRIEQARVDVTEIVGGLTTEGTTGDEATA